MDSARPYPPSAQRIAEARASGHVPQAVLVATSAALVFLLASGWLLGPPLLAQLESLLRTTLTAVARGDSALAHRLLSSFLRDLTASAALTLGALFASIAAACALAQGPSFGLARARGGAPLGKLSPSRVAPVLWCLGLALSTFFTLSQLLAVDRAKLAELAATWAQCAALLALLCTLIDVAFARARFFASLWMSRREQLDEQRAAFGSPELRAARARLSRQDRAVAASPPLEEQA